MVGVWSALRLDVSYHQGDMNIADWLHSHASSDYGLLFMISCWIIWKFRNKEVIQNASTNTWVVLHQIHNLFDDVSRAFKYNTMTRTTSQIRWTPPPEGTSKLNADGSSLGTLGSWVSVELSKIIGVDGRLFSKVRAVLPTLSMWSCRLFLMVSI